MLNEMLVLFSSFSPLLSGAVLMTNELRPAEVDTHTHTRIHTSLTLNVRTVVAVAELYNSREESAQQLDDRLDRREE